MECRPRACRTQLHNYILIIIETPISRIVIIIGVLFLKAIGIGENVIGVFNDFSVTFKLLLQTHHVK